MIKINQRQVGNVTVLDITGRITQGEGAETLKHTIVKCFENDSKRVLLNLANVSYIDSTGLSTLISQCDTSLINNGRQIKLVNLAKRVRDLLQITKLYCNFDVHDDEAAAIRSFS